MVKKICPTDNYVSLVVLCGKVYNVDTATRGTETTKKGVFMEQTAKIIGANIAAFRKAKGLTQEQLAAKLGVSPPAVSKWETGSSCPDIALLCPLARALDTHVDALLQFEETLSE